MVATAHNPGKNHGKLKHVAIRASRVQEEAHLQTINVAHCLHAGRHPDKGSGQGSVEETSSRNSWPLQTQRIKAIPRETADSSKEPEHQFGGVTEIDTNQPLAPYQLA